MAHPGSSSRGVIDDFVAASSSSARTLHYSNMLDADDVDKSPNTHSFSSAATTPSTTTTTSETTTSSAPVYGDELFALPAACLDFASSSATTKAREVDVGEEERDSYSPLSSSHSNSPSDEAAAAVALCNGATTLPVLPTGSGFDNKIYDGGLLQAHKSVAKTNSSSTSALAAAAAVAAATSKEEKQRQNEEIVIMETSSISSETGSWESVFPHAAQLTAAGGSSNKVLTLDSWQQRDKPKEKDKRVKQPESGLRERLLLNDMREHGLTDTEPLRMRTYSTGADNSTLLNGVSAVGGGSSSSLLGLRDCERSICDNALTTSGTSACFIDASSLRDEDEEVQSFPSLDGHQSCDEHDTKLMECETVAAGEEMLEAEVAEDSPTQALETFHKAFAKCKAKSKVESIKAVDDSCSSASSISGSSSPCKEASNTSPTNNLSDEEKLWKRELSTTTTTQSQPAPLSVDEEPDKQSTIGGDKDTSQENNLHLLSAGHEDATELSISLAADLDSSDSSEIVKLRREQERRHGGGTGGSGSYAFMQHYVGAGTGISSTKLPFHATNAHHSDLSYTTDYSSSSPAPSLVWSEHEQRPMRQHHAVQYQQQQHDYDAHLHKSCPMMPDTPHNSIAHISDTPLSANSSIHRDYTTLSSSCSQQRDSGAYCSDATDSPVPMPRTPKRFSKCDEANPIISGGASFKDFGGGSDGKQCDSPILKRRTDTCPIVSGGGFRSLDFARTLPLKDEQSETNELGADDDEEEEVELRAKPTTRKPLSALTSSWIVDMSDCRRERRKSTSSTASSGVDNVPRFRERTDSGSSQKSSCGFYVSLEHMDAEKREVDEQSKPTAPHMSKSYTGPRSTGFFVNLEESEAATTLKHNETSAIEEIAQKPPGEDVNVVEKPNLFSMFIDFGEKKISNGIRREPFNLAARLSSSFTSNSPSATAGAAAHQRRTEDAMRSSASSTETLMSKSNTYKPYLDNENESKSLDYKCNREKPMTVAEIRRISQQQRAQSEAATKRHSWGNSQSKDGAPQVDYKRSISLTTGSTTGSGNESKDIINNGGGLMSIIDKLPLISKTSSLSIDSSLSPPYGSKSELSSSCSNNSGEDAQQPLHGGKLKKRRKDVQINETFDKSSIASLTDGVLSKDLSPASTTDTEDLTFQQDEELALREAAALQQQQQALNTTVPVLQVPTTRSSAIIMETILEAKETASPKKNASGHTMETLHATIEKQKQLLETVNEHEKSAFVKLSDMDKPLNKYEPHSPEAMMSKSAGGTHRQIGSRLFRDDANMKPVGSSARPHSWSMMTRSSGNASFLNITTSVDNLRSLSRIFPNFSKEFSNSLPNDMILDQQLDDYIQTDISADSSLASSFSRSGMDESSLSCRQPRRLGEDLLKMFLQEIATDMLVEVSGRRIRAHKCILRSRCQYFAAMLAGNGAAGQSVVSLPGYSYSAVHFALCHIYSGASHPPDGISLMELAALADLLGLEGLKEVTAHALKTNYCHNFHKPCSGCIDGILQVLPVALNHALDDLYRKCLRWTCRHYLKVWPTRQFAQLPSDILGRCRQQIVAYLTSETVLDTVLDCDNLIAQLAPYRWGGICENLVRDIMDAAYTYIGEHFASLIASDAFLSLGHDKSCHIPRLQEMLLRTAATLTADQACRSYQRVTRLNTVLQARVIKMPASLACDLARELQGLQDEELEWDPEYISLVSAILSTAEQCLTRQCSRAMRVTAWQRMDLELRKKIQTLARLTDGPAGDMKRGGGPGTGSGGGALSKGVSKAFSFGGSTRNQDLYQVKLAIQAHSKRALAQDTQLYKATQTQPADAAVQTAERGVQANHDLREGTSKVLKSNSRAHVPQPYKGLSGSAAGSERNSINTHRRTQSEAPPQCRTSSSAQTSQLHSHSQSQPPPSHQQQQQRPPPAESKPSAPKARLTEVRPRYLEPRKPRAATTNATNGPVRSATSASITGNKTQSGTQHHHRLSSSDSSRNSSPAMRKTGPNAATSKIGSKSINMSTDSLASPARRARARKTCDNERYSSDACVDSLADSMKSSVLSNANNKSMSQESLAGAPKLTRSNPVIVSHNNNNNRLFRTTQPQHNANNTNSNSSSSKLNGNVLKPQIKLAATKAPHKLQLQQQHSKIASNGSSPSSVVTTKSTSRLSSISSNNSARDLYKHRSISMPGQQQQDNSAGGRRSFLSAKSREILAKRAEKNKQQQKPQPYTSSGDEKTSTTTTTHSTTNNISVAHPPMRSSSHSAVPLAISRTSLTSNIPTRRPNTLHLKKTHQVSSNVVNHTNANSNNNKTITTTTNIKNKLASSLGYKANTVAHAVQQKIELLIDSSSARRTALKQQQQQEILPHAAERIESKLERSGTFCKESSDLDLNDLQIIE